MNEREPNLPADADDPKQDDLAMASPSGETLDVTTGWLPPTKTASDRALNRSPNGFALPYDLGRYRLTKELAHGGMGVIYLAHQADLDRLVAIKMVLQGAMASEQELQRFRMEAEAAAQLSHPGIVSIYEIGEYGGRPFIAMEYVEGVDLSEKLKGEPLVARDAAELVLQAAKAIQHAHEQGVLHRDLKPSNLLIDKAGRIRVSDFGLAKRMTSEHDLTQTGQGLGTPSFASPEQFDGKGEVGPATDVYGLGATLYSLLTGVPPFREATPLETIKAVLQNEPQRPSLRRPVSSDLETICLKCLAKEQTDRYGTAAELAEDLKRFLDGEPIVGRRLSPAQLAWRWLRRHPSKVATMIGGLAALVMIGVLAYFAVQSNSGRRKAEQFQQASTAVSRLLEKPKTDLVYLKELDEGLERLRALDADDAEAYERNTYSRLVQFVIDQPRVADGLEFAEAALERLEEVDPEQATSLRRDLDDRKKRWETVVELSAPFENAQDVFPNVPTLQIDGNSLRHSAGDALLLTSTPSVGECEMEVEFAPDWRKGQAIGIAFGAESESGESRAERRFQIRPIGDGRLVVEIFRDKELLQAEDYSLDQVSDQEPLRLVSRSSLRSYSIQVNDLPPIKAMEVFDRGARSGRFAVIWPKDTSLLRLQLQRPALGAKRSHLEEGDRLAFEKDYANAIRSYERQLREAGGKDDLKAELRCKIAICLVRTRNVAAALKELEALSQDLKDDDRWGFLAACELWKLYIDDKKYDKATKLFHTLAFLHGDQLANFAPRAVYSEMLARLVDQGALASLDDVSPEGLRQVDLLLQTQERIDPDSAHAWRLRWRLITAYDSRSEFAKAARMIDRLLANPALPLNHHTDLLAERARVFVHAGDVPGAMTFIDQELRSPPTSAARMHLLLTRARLHARLGNLNAAHDDAEACAATHGNTSITWLLRGAIAWRQNRRQRAKELWANGFKAARAYPYPNSPEVMLGSLSEEMTNTDLNKMFDKWRTNRQGGRLLSLLHVYIGKMHRIVDPMWRTARGRSLLDDFMFMKLDERSNITAPPRIAIYELCRQTVLNEAEHPVTPSLEAPEADVDNILWALAGDIVQAYDAGELSQLQAGYLFLAWNDLNLDAWENGAAGLPAATRAKAAFVLAHRFAHKTKRDEARKLFQESVDQAGDQQVLKKLAADWVTKIPE